MTILLNFNKHFNQIKKGIIIVVINKIRSLVYLILQIPIYLLSIPAIFIIRLIRPWFLIRWRELESSRIGHFAIDVETYCCEIDAKINTPPQRFLDCFYLMKYISSKQLEKMCKRRLIILPRWLLIPLLKVNRFINIFISNGHYHEIGKICKVERDTINLLERFTPHINLTEKEKLDGKKFLTEFGLPENAKFVCLIVRDSAYLNRHTNFSLRKWNYHNHRDGDIDRYVLAAEELAKRGYYVFRMGVKVLKPLKSSNPKIIDYANSKMKSSFMDIYLGINCSFCISTGLGFDEIPRIFRKPIANIYVPLVVPYRYLINNNENDLIITKHHVHKKNKKILSISEIFSSNVASAWHCEKYELNNVELKENSPEEIKDFVVEMDERLNANWKETEEDIFLQKKFWTICDENMRRLNIMPYNGKVKIKFGAKYLRENQNWLK